MMKPFSSFLIEKFYKDNSFTDFNTYTHAQYQDREKRYNKLKKLGEILSNHYQAEHSKAGVLSSNYVISKYTMGSKMFNNSLHERFNTLSPVYELHKEIVDELDKHLSSYKSPKTFHVYTGLKEDPTNSSSLKKYSNEKGHLKAIVPSYISTSIDPLEAKFHAHEIQDNKAFKRHILKIEIPKGSNHGAYIARHSKYPDEKEFLLKRGTKLHIHPEPQIIGSHATGTKNYIWHAKIIGNHYENENT